MDLHEGPKCGPRIEGPHSAGGSIQVHEGPHRDHGQVLHKVHYIYIHIVSRNKSLNGEQGPGYRLNKATLLRMQKIQEKQA